MNSNLPALDAEWQKIEDDLAGLLARVERRQRLAPATEEDGNLNHMLHDNLQRIVGLTSQFTAVRHGHCSLQTQADGLNALAQATTPMVTIVKALENAPPLSPLFERMMNREYNEFVGLTVRTRDAVVQNSQQLLAAAETNPPPAAAGPFATAWGVMMAPCAMAWMMSAAWMSAWQIPAQPSRREAHLRLAYSRN